MINLKNKLNKVAKNAFQWIIDNKLRKFGSTDFNVSIEQHKLHKKDDEILRKALTSPGLTISARI